MAGPTNPFGSHLDKRRTSRRAPGSAMALPILTHGKWLFKMGTRAHDYFCRLLADGPVYANASPLGDQPASQSRKVSQVSQVSQESRSREHESRSRDLEARGREQEGRGREQEGRGREQEGRGREQGDSRKVSAESQQATEMRHRKSDISLRSSHSGHVRSGSYDNIPGTQAQQQHYSPQVGRERRVLRVPEIIHPIHRPRLPEATRPSPSPAGALWKASLALPSRAWGWWRRPAGNLTT